MGNIENGKKNIENDEKIIAIQRLVIDLQLYAQLIDLTQTHRLIMIWLKATNFKLVLNQKP
jgi:hypothetical protein